MNWYQRSAYESLVSNQPGRGEVEIFRISNGVRPNFKVMTRLNFDGVTVPAAPGNYGNILDCTWLSIAGGGSFGAKLMFSNPAVDSSVLYGLGLRVRSNYAGAKVVGLNVSVSANVANAGQLIGGQFYMDTGAYAITTSLACCALYCKTRNAAANPNVTSSLWVDDGATVKPSTSYMIDVTMNGNTITHDAVFHIYGGSKGADSLFLFDTCEQGGSFLTVTGAGGGTRAASIKVQYKIGGGAYATGYLTIFSS
jgi:hypothetical protein